MPATTAPRLDRIADSAAYRPSATRPGAPNPERSDRTSHPKRPDRCAAGSRLCTRIAPAYETARPALRPVWLEWPDRVHRSEIYTSFVRRSTPGRRATFPHRPSESLHRSGRIQVAGPAIARRDAQALFRAPLLPLQYRATALATIFAGPRRGGYLVRVLGPIHYRAAPSQTGCASPSAPTNEASAILFGLAHRECQRLAGSGRD